MTLAEVTRLKRELASEFAPYRTIRGVGQVDGTSMLVGWTLIVGVTALIFWGTLRPARRA